MGKASVENYAVKTDLGTILVGATLEKLQIDLEHLAMLYRQQDGDFRPLLEYLMAVDESGWFAETLKDFGGYTFLAKNKSNIAKFLGIVEKELRARSEEEAAKEEARAKLDSARRGNILSAFARSSKDAMPKEELVRRSLVIAQPQDFDFETEAIDLEITSMVKQGLLDTGSKRLGVKLTDKGKKAAE